MGGKRGGQNQIPHRGAFQGRELPHHHQKVPSAGECHSGHPKTGGADRTICAGHQTLLHSEEVQRGRTKGHGSGNEERLRHEGTETNVDHVLEVVVGGVGGDGSMVWEDD